MSIKVLEVRDTFLDCLFRDDEPTEPHVLAEGIMTTVGFHPGRLESHREQVKGWLDQLPEPFHQVSGGGWSFLNACIDADGELWTGEQRSVEQLVTLGIGLGLVQYLMPRRFWPALPGGVPYFVVL